MQCAKSTTPIAEPIAITPSLVAMLVSPADDLKRFRLACVPQAKGRHIALGEVYPRYRRWCDNQKATLLSAQVFAKEFELMSQRGAMREARDGMKIYCLDVRLVT